MKKQIVILAIAILLIVVGLTGCFDSDNESKSELDKFVGTWKHGTLQNGGNITFLSDGTGNYQGNSAEWKIENGKLVVDLTDRELILTFNYEFLYDDQILILTDVETEHVDDYKKQ